MTEINLGIYKIAKYIFASSDIPIFEEFCFSRMLVALAYLDQFIFYS